MCLDISFKIAETEDSLFDYLPHLKIDPQLDIKFDLNSHMQAHNRPLTKVIYINEDGDPYLTYMRWGVLKKYMFKDVGSFNKYANNSYNARSESVFSDKRSMWYQIRGNRCLIDTPGIYEHRAIKGWKNKVPYFIQLASGKRMLIPAFYTYLDLSPEDIDRIKAIDNKYMNEAINKTLNFETGKVMGTYAMITTRANDVMKNIHNDGTNKHRMPLFFEPEQAVRWINKGLNENEIQQMLDYSIPSESLKVTPVWTIRTDKERPDGKMKHEYWEWPGLPPLGIDEFKPAELF